MMSTSNSSSSSGVKEQVLSWLHDDESLVTSQRIQQHCRNYNNDNDNNDDDNDGHAISRYEGSQLLRELFMDGVRGDNGSNNNNNKYIPTLCTINEYTTPVSSDNQGGIPHEFKTTEFNLNSKQKHDNSNTIPEDAIVFALRSHQSLDPIDSIHEQDMSFLRDQITDQNIVWYYDNELCYIKQSLALGVKDDNKPATAIEKTWHKRVKITNNATSNKISKPTTAKTFFNNKDNKEATTTEAAATKAAAAGKTKKNMFAAAAVVKKKKSVVEKSTSVVAVAVADVSNSNNKKKIPAAFTKRTRPSGSSSHDDDADDDDDDEEEEKKKKKKHVGTADDFIGDEDEDSEDEDEMNNRRIKSKEIIRKQLEQDAMIDALGDEEDQNMEDDKPILVRGAMDAFAVTKKKDASASASQDDDIDGGSRKKKKRKTIKEKTAVNAQGYLVTTTEEVWIEIDTDDEKEEEKQKKNKTSSSSSYTSSKSSNSKSKIKINVTKKKAASDMKQGSISGFFAVKKK